MRQEPNIFQSILPLILSFFLFFHLLHLMLDPIRLDQTGGRPNHPNRPIPGWPERHFSLSAKKYPCYIYVIKKSMVSCRGLWWDRSFSSFSLFFLAAITWLSHLLLWYPPTPRPPAHSLLCWLTYYVSVEEQYGTVYCATIWKGVKANFLQDLLRFTPENRQREQGGRRQEKWNKWVPRKSPSSSQP